MIPIYAKEAGRIGSVGNPAVPDTYCAYFEVKFDNSEHTKTLKLHTDKRYQLTHAYSIDDSKEQVECTDTDWANALLKTTNQSGHYSSGTPKSFRLEEKENDGYCYALTDETKAKKMSALKKA